MLCSMHLLNCLQVLMLVHFHMYFNSGKPVRLILQFDLILTWSEPKEALQSAVDHPVLETSSQTPLSPDQSIRMRAYGMMCIVNSLTRTGNLDPTSTNALFSLLHMTQSHEPTSLRKADIDALLQHWSRLDLQLLWVRSALLSQTFNLNFLMYLIDTSIIWTRSIGKTALDDSWQGLE